MRYEIQEITPKDDAKIYNIIQDVAKEFGAIGEGFGPSDPEVASMSGYYNDNSCSRYLVAFINGKLIGGCGIAAFNGDNEICELRKLFLLPEARGLGIGKKLTEDCLLYAKNKAYEHCYLDTLTTMTSAIALYKSLGFKHLEKPLPESMHNACNVWMLKQL